MNDKKERSEQCFHDENLSGSKESVVVAVIIGRATFRIVPCPFASGSFADDTKYRIGSGKEASRFSDDGESVRNWYAF